MNESLKVSSENVYASYHATSSVPTRPFVFFLPLKLIKFIFNFLSWKILAASQKTKKIAQDLGRLQVISPSDFKVCFRNFFQLFFSHYSSRKHYFVKAVFFPTSSCVNSNPYFFGHNHSVTLKRLNVFEKKTEKILSWKPNWSEAYQLHHLMVWWFSCPSSWNLSRCGNGVWGCALLIWPNLSYNIRQLSSWIWRKNSRWSSSKHHQLQKGIAFHWSAKWLCLAGDFVKI